MDLFLACLVYVYFASLAIFYGILLYAIFPLCAQKIKQDGLALWFRIKRKIKNCFHIVRSYVNRPYPFQLWVAPRHSNFLARWTAEKSGGGEYNISSPPGFDEQLNGPQSNKSEQVEKEKKKSKRQKQPHYALFLNPDNLSMYWIIFFLFTVLPGFSLGLFIPCEKYLFASLATAAFFFIAAYRLIYSFFRKPILDDLWKEWPQTAKQKRYFQNIPSKITFCSKEHTKQYRKKNPFVNPSRKNWWKSLWKKDPCGKTLNTFYFQRPVFYSPGRSLQEALLRTGITSFFSGARNRKNSSPYSLISFAAYYFAHIWVSYLWFLIQLLCIFISGTRPDDSTMLRFVVPIICWTALTTLSLFAQFRFLNGPLVRYDPDLFFLAPPRLEEIFKKNMRLIQSTMPYLPKLLSIVAGATIAVYLALVTLIMQATDPSEKNLQCKETTSHYSLFCEIKKR